MKTNNTVFYAGDSPVGGAANYLLAILASMKLRVKHIPPGRKVRPADLRERYGLYIFSDYSRNDLLAAAEEKIAEDVENGSGLLMIGGWGSFSGPFGHWQGSLLEDYLPVRCLTRDDRVNWWSGMAVSPAETHSILKGLSFKRSPGICGLNHLKARKDAITVLQAVPLDLSPGRVSLKNDRKFPLLCLNRSTVMRTAALATDLAPHWCAGWVDWGTKRKRLPVNSRIAVEVGADYIRFTQQLIRWCLNAR